MKSGLYALACLDGAPIAAGDAAVLGLEITPGPFAVGLVDETAGPTHSGTAARDGVTVALLGWLDDPLALAVELGAPPNAEPALLALLAFARWGTALPGQLPGEWSLIRCDPRRGELLLAASETLRDPMFWARDHGRVAVAPSLKALSRLPWVSGEFDALGVVQSLSRWYIRNALDNRPLLKGVHRVEHGSVHIVTREGERAIARPAPRQPARWTGDFEDAVVALEARARLVLRRHLARHAHATVLLSGGLDSTVLALLASEELPDGTRLSAVSSVAPPGSDVPDERRFIDIVVRELDLQLTPVCPPADDEIYIPRDRTFAQAEAPVTGPRHYLYAALFDAGVTMGASAALDGSFGEFSLTRRARLLGAANVLRTIRGGLRDLSRRPQRATGLDAGFLVRPSPVLLSMLRAQFPDGWPSEAAATPLRLPGSALGFPAGTAKTGRLTTSTGHGLRRLCPFRDPDMIALTASFPVGFTERGGLSRAFARSMLRRRLPQISERTDKHPFAPDFYARLKREASSAVARVGLYRRYGATDWIDVDWLERELTALARGDRKPARLMIEIHNAAVAAEFFVWWGTGGTA